MSLGDEILLGILWGLYLIGWAVIVTVGIGILVAIGAGMNRLFQYLYERLR